jgi:hypothetical protein
LQETRLLLLELRFAEGPLVAEADEFGEFVCDGCPGRGDRLRGRSRRGGRPNRPPAGGESGTNSDEDESEGLVFFGDALVLLGFEGGVFGFSTGFVVEDVGQSAAELSMAAWSAALLSLLAGM